MQPFKLSMDPYLEDHVTRLIWDSTEDMDYQKLLKLQLQLQKNFPYLCILLLHSPLVLSQDTPAVFEIHKVQIDPAIAAESQELVVSVVGINIAAFDFTGLPAGGRPGIIANENSYEVAIEGDQITIDYRGPGNCISPRRPLPANSEPQIKKMVIQGMPAGEYTLNINYSIGCGSRVTAASTSLVVYESAFERLHFWETPKANSTVSGVGVLRGWACHAKNEDEPFEGPTIGTLGYKIDDSDEISFAYPTSRTDTEIACGEGNYLTGFGAVDYWGKYGAGTHSITLMIDGEPVETRSFTIVAPPGGFLQGIVSEYVLEDFPSSGQSVGIEWSEADQNFIIVESN